MTLCYGWRPARRLWLTGLTLATLLAVAGGGSAARAEEPLPVSLARVQFSEAGAGLELTGVIAAKDQFSAGFPGGGQVIAVHVEAGEEVQRGQLLAEQDPTQAREALRAAEAALTAAEAALLRIEREMERDKALSSRGYVAAAQLERAEEGLISAKASRTQAQTRVDAARKALEDTRLTAQSDAVVLRRNAEGGQVVGAAQSVLDLAGRGGRDAVFVAPADFDLSALPGQWVTLQTIEPPERSFRAVIDQVSPMIDPGTGGIRVKASLEEGGSAVLNEPVTAVLPLGIGRAAELPAAALSRNREGPAVWRVGAEGRVELVPVRVAHYGTATVFISAGLEDGQEVVAEGAAYLYPGRKVRAVAQEAE